MSGAGATPGFHHVAIRAVDFDATVRFYTQGLGFTVHYGFSVPGRIDRAVFLDAGDGRYFEVFGQGISGRDLILIGGPHCVQRRPGGRGASG